LGETVVNNGEATLPVTRSGAGQPIVFFNGGGATQISWKKVIQQLHGHYETVTFDFRGHGKASQATDYSFEAFLSDAETVMRTIDVAKPIVVGWSLGADVAAEYAARHNGKVAGLVIIDGAVPLPEPLVEDAVGMRRSLNSPIMKLSMLLARLTPYGYALNGDAFADITLELDGRRQSALIDVYGSVDCPVAVLLATKSAGEKGAHAARNNSLRHAGAELLAGRYPSISIQWIDGTHSLPFRHPAEIAKTIDEIAGQLSAKQIPGAPT